MTGIALALSVALALLCRPQTAGAVEEDTIGWWIHAGSVRSTLVSRYIGPEGATPERAAIAQAERTCGLTARIDPLDGFDATPIGAEPVVFGPFLSLSRIAPALACIRRSVPAAFVTPARPPAP
jgi:hypothetical protein